MCLFPGSLFNSTDVFVHSYAHTNVLITLALEWITTWASVDHPDLFFCKIALDILGSFPFHKNFRISLLVSTENLAWWGCDWHWICRSFWIIVDLMLHLAVRRYLWLLFGLFTSFQWSLGVFRVEVLHNFVGFFFFFLRVLQIGFKIFILQFCAASI